MKKITQNNITDKELVTKYQQEGSREALGLLYKRYSHLIFGLCLNYLKNKEDARDAVMDIFEKTAKKLATHDVQTFKTWIFYVSRNHCLNQIRDRYKHISRELNEKDEALFVEFKEDTGHYSDAKIDALNDAINALKSHQRDCVILFYLKGLSYEKVAAQTGFSEKEVKSYLQNGRRNLKNAILKIENE